jgi:hypothetical protein
VSTIDRGQRDERDAPASGRYGNDEAMDGAYGLDAASASYASDESARDALRPVANPDDPIVRRPPADARGPRPGPDFRGALGRVAIVQGQVYIVASILIAQLFLITTALYELLSGRTDLLVWIAVAQLGGFIITLVVALAPRQRVRGF